VSYIDSIYKLKYIDTVEALNKTLLDVEDFKLEYQISPKNFKYIQKNILFHFLFINLISLLREVNLNNEFKPVLYVDEKNIPSSLPLIEQLKKIKKIFPIPFLIGVDTSLFTGSGGPLKEINRKVMNFYGKRRVELREIKKYLDTKGFNTLSNTLSSVVDLKGFYY
jgi:hypothetical protein